VEARYGYPTRHRAVIEIKRWKWAGAPAWEWIPGVPERVTVQQTYANHTVGGTAESGEHMLLARNEFTGDWYEICGPPTSMRVPCKTAAPECNAGFGTGKRLLREDTPWE
jgi:hypothetical protein